MTARRTVFVCNGAGGVVSEEPSAEAGRTQKQPAAQPAKLPGEWRPYGSPAAPPARAEEVTLPGVPGKWKPYSPPQPK